jgi:hypothetical protein
MVSFISSTRSTAAASATSHIVLWSLDQITEARCSAIQDRKPQWAKMVQLIDALHNGIVGELALLRLVQNWIVLFRIEPTH